MDAPQLVNVARPGVIVSTIKDGAQAQTVVFTADAREDIGFTTEVFYSPVQHGLAEHANQVARVSR